MFGTTAVTAWELEAERRVELAQAGRARFSADDTPRVGVFMRLRRRFGVMPETRPAHLKDVRA